jgi:DNA-binding MarR family transcriptional regulator
MTTKRKQKDERYRDTCFPDAAKEVFAPRTGGYAPLPYIAREILRYLEGAEIKVWIYLLTRGGPQSICYPTYEDIMRGTGIKAKGTVSKAIHRLEKIGLIRSHNDRGTRRYLLRDPRLAVAKLYELNEMTKGELEEANDLLEIMKLPLIEAKPKVAVPKVAKKKSTGGGK